MFRGIYRILLIIGLFFLVSSYTNYLKVHGYSEIDQDPPFLGYRSLWVDSLINTMSLEEKIGQSLMIAAYSNKNEEHAEELERIIKEYHVGGLIFFQGGPVRQAKLTNHLQSISEVPLLISMDAEWGLGMRLDSTISYPRQMVLGALSDNKLIYQMGADIARQCNRLGVHVNFAPVVDVNNNPDNPVINSRSFGENKHRVTSKGIAYMKGLQDNHVIATAKHFPGHGDTDSDSHYTLPRILHSRERMDTLELYPFKKLIDKGVGGVMIAHLNIPALDSTPNLASTLSYPMVSDLLINDLQFKGLIITDALSMKGVDIENDEPGQIELNAFLAGNDILLMPRDVPETISKIKNAVKSGIISEQTIDYRCKKILAAKEWAGLNEFKPVKLENLYADLNNPASNLINNRLIKSSMTVVRNENELMPIQRLDTLKIASLAIGETTKNIYQEYLQRYANVKDYHLPQDAPSTQFEAYKHLLKQYNLVIISVHQTDRRPSRDFGISQKTIDFVNDIVQNNQVILNIFANPYSLALFNDLESTSGIIVSYHDDELYQQYAAQVIFGGIKSDGMLPVGAGNKFREGTGKKITPVRLGYVIPEDVGISSRKLTKVDSLVMDAIEKEATPGCQVLAARYGKVFLYKGYGHHTYLQRDTVKPTDLYDLASITKIAATLPILMEMVDSGKLNINAPLKDYLPESDTTNKGNLVIMEMLAHQAGLKPWIPFYMQTLEPMAKNSAIFHRRLSDNYPIKLADRFYINRNLRYKDNIYNTFFTDTFPVKVAENLFMNRSYVDSIYYNIYSSELLKKKEYKYSDLAYYLFYKFIEGTLDKPFYSYLYLNYYQPMGTTSLGFLPLNRFSKERIIPTENDVVYRRQLLHGHVHDPGAAMMGGIAGHAGLFSNANDLAKFMQMYLNGGTYGGKEYLSPETLKTFTTSWYRGNENRRGLGFDKPEIDKDKEGPTIKDISPKSFGHSGFTGTIAWADPETGIVYIFLSNRIHPNQDNLKLVEMDVRTNIQQAIYDAIIKGGR